MPDGDRGADAPFAYGQYASLPTGRDTRFHFCLAGGPRDAGRVLTPRHRVARATWSAAPCAVAYRARRQFQHRPPLGEHDRAHSAEAPFPTETPAFTTRRRWPRATRTAAPTRGHTQGTTPAYMLRRCFARVTLNADIDGGAVELCAGMGAAIDTGTNTYRSRGSQATLALPARPQRGARLSTPARYHHRSRGNQATIARLDGYRDQLNARSAECGAICRRLQAATPILTL